MASLAIHRWVTAAVGWIPAPLHRALDAWSQRRAFRRRARRLQLARQPR
jgi:hypothetical protein